MSEATGALETLAARLCEQAVGAGADEAEVLVREGRELSTQVRLGEPEVVRESGSSALGLRVFVDKRAAVTYTSDLRSAALEALVVETVALARLSEPDEHNYLPDRSSQAAKIPELDLYDPETETVTAAIALERAIRGEKAALNSDPRITNSGGATWSRIIGSMAFANSAGFVAGYRGTYSSFVVRPICDDADGKKRDGFWWTAGRFLSQLEDAEAVGVEAARRTIAQLGASKIPTAEMPVVFDPEAGRAIVGAIFGLANGSSFYRKSSYFIGREQTPVASDKVTVVDDPLIPRGPGSRPFDGDGLATRKNVIIDGGVLSTILCDTYTARQLGRTSTGSAGRGVGGSPAPTTSNLTMQAGEHTPMEILKESNGGLYVTSLMGFGFNPVTGDYSQGASGFIIEGGDLGRPVTEVTISANFDDLLKGIDLVGDDLEMRTSTACPTFRVARMTVAGS